MVDEGQEMEAAMEAHFVKYHSAKSAAEQDAIRNEVRRNMAIGLETHDLILAFERVTVTPADYRAGMMKVLQSWKEPEQPYMVQFDQTAEEYRANDGLGIWMNDAGEQIVPEVSNPVSMHRLFGGRSECPDTEVIVFLFETDEGGRLTAFHQAVARPAWAASIATEREAAAMSSGGDAKLDL